ncbi:type II secretion system protein M [Stecheria sp. CLA-KB-P133]|uniref:Type II secretion system protein M n=1 Tax=Grylomicrobium aquisgranensis TaxID=2926318 RepID=A0AB35U1K6_9FIRM|nr:hypothetical protein [Lactimicrobium massiliense]MDD6675595.1 hypothetical protein [Lactimicrobium massiliense]MDD6726218.1 hypothetical protein [Lactimicrobium massiliense]MDX8419592.1 type II secretion system protein M [Stecheria sp. CLA-KB-P133]
MFSYKFSLREKILLLICLVIALGIFYYEVAFKGFQSAAKQYDTSELQTQLTVLQSQAAKQKQMQNYLDSNDTASVGTVAVYNNLANEVSALGNILNDKASQVSITWSEPTLTDNIVRRNASISFHTSGYDTAYSLVESIARCQYRCLIADVSMDDGDDTDLSSSSDVAVSMNITFFETTDGASSTSGLVQQDSDSTSDNSGTVFKGDATYN